MQYIDRDGNRHNIPLYGLQPTISPDDDNQLHESPNGLKVGWPKRLDGQMVSVEQLNEAVVKAHEHANRELLDSLVNDGDGEKFLSNDGTYKESSKSTQKDVLDALYPIGSYAFGKKPNIGTWEEVGIKGRYMHNIILRDSDTLMMFVTIINGNSSALSTHNTVCQAIYNNGHRSVSTAIQTSGHNNDTTTYSATYSPNGASLYSYRVPSGIWGATNWKSYNDIVTDLIGYNTYKRIA